MPRYTDAEAGAYLDSRASQYNSGYIRFYNGTRPATGDTALSGNTLLATCRFGSTAFPAASSRVLTANAITGDTSAAATGVPTFARLFKSDGTTVLCDCSVGISGAEMIISTPLGDGTITATGPVNVASYTVTFPVG